MSPFGTCWGMMTQIRRRLCMYTVHMLPGGSKGHNLLLHPAHTSYCFQTNYSSICCEISLLLQLISWANRYYDTVTEQCRSFVYTGCQGNENKFRTYDDCQYACPRPSSDPCSHPIVTGRCKAKIPRWAYSTESGTCVEFVYGGCGPTGNNFLSKDECMETCIGKVLLSPQKRYIRQNTWAAKTSRRQAKNNAQCLLARRATSQHAHGHTALEKCRLWCCALVRES